MIPYLLENLRKQKALIALLLLGCLGLGSYVLLHDKVFVWASLDLSLTRKQAIDDSQQFLLQRGYRIGDYRSAASFWTRKTPVIYLEKSLGTAEANDLLRSKDLPVWGWAVRFFQPLEKEEYTVWWSPKGTFIGFRQDILREKALPSLSKEEALSLASQFLGSHFPRSSSEYELVEESATERIARVDHTFRWKAKESPLETRRYVRVIVSGNQVTYGAKELELPQSFIRTEKNTGSQRELLQQVVTNLDFLLSMAIYVFLLIAWRRHWLRWKAAIQLAALLLGIRIIATANGLPGLWYEYSTQDSILVYWAQAVGTSVLVLVAFSAWQILSFSSADAMGRTPSHARYSFGDLTNSKFFHSRSFFLATIAGFATAGIHLGFVAIFYLFGSRVLGVYAPLDVPYDNLFSTALPWVGPLLTGLEPALQEETVYRLFAIPLLLRLTKRKFIAVVVPAVVWGFLHSGYYVEPIYARGLELTVIGIVLGLVYLRYGIWATIVSHYIYNATVSSSLLLASDNIYFGLSAALVIAFIAIPLVWSIGRILLNVAPGEFIFKPLAWKTISVTKAFKMERRKADKSPLLQLRLPLILAFVTFVANLLLPGKLAAPSIGLERHQAIAAAKNELQRLGYPVEEAKISSVFQETSRSGGVLRYVRRHLSFAEASTYLDRFQAVEPYWTIRFVTPEHPEECQMNLGKGGEILFFQCRQAEKAHGPNLAADESKLIAQQYLEKVIVTSSKFEYAGSTERDRPNRKDILHRWVDPSANLAEMKRYISIEVEGDRISTFSTNLELPESFLREQQQTTIWQTLQAIGMFLFILTGFALIIRSFFDHYVVVHFRDRLPFFVGLFMMCLPLFEWFNELPMLWLNYDTATTLNTFYFKTLSSLFGKMFLTGISSYLVVLLFTTLTPQVFATAPTIDKIRPMLRNPPWKWRGSRAAFAWALLLFLLLFFFEEGAGLVRSKDIYGESIDVAYSSYSTYFPAITTLFRVPYTLLIWAAIGASFAAIKKYSHPWVLRVFLVGFVGYMIDFSWNGWLETLQTLLTTVTFWFIILRVVRFHLPFYFWYALLTSVIPFVPWLLSESGAFRDQAFIVVLAFSTLVIALFFKRRKQRLPGYQVEDPNRDR